MVLGLVEKFLCPIAPNLLQTTLCAMDIDPMWKVLLHVEVRLNLSSLLAKRLMVTGKNVELV